MTDSFRDVPTATSVYPNILLSGSPAADGSMRNGSGPAHPTYSAPTGYPSAPVPPAVSARDGNRTLGILSLIGGIASLVFGQTIVLPIAAIVLGFLALQRELASRSFAIWGIVLSVVALFGWVIFIVLGLVFAAPFFLIGAL